MNVKERKREWQNEEDLAQIHGWDFSHIHGRYDEERDLPWDYEQTVRALLTPSARVLDMDTGGGEFLLSLGHPCALLSATEGYPPNAALCRETLSPLGVDFHEAPGGGPLPFPGGAFELVMNRHGDYDPREVFRVLKPGGVFVTEQVGAENDRELVELLLGPGLPLPYPRQRLVIAREELETAGFTVRTAQEAFRPIRFWDVGALVWFARVIPWEFSGFSVERCLPALWRAQELLERQGVLEGTIHRYLLVCERP